MNALFCRRVLAARVLLSSCCAASLWACDPASTALLTVDAGADGGQPGSADLGGQRPQTPDLTQIVPWKAIDLAGPTDLVWQEYDYRPRAQGGFQEDIDSTLDALRALGVRQVEIQSWYAWSVEKTVYPTTSIKSVVYYQPGYDPVDPSTWKGLTRARRGDMAPMPYLQDGIPSSWDQPHPLANPVEIERKAEQVLGDMLDAVYRKGLIPVLKSEIYLMVAQDLNDYSADFNYTDPSRNFDQFYSQYKQYLINMTRLGARHHAAMIILGTETPYVAGAGQSYFIDGSKMTDRQAMIYKKWQDIISAVRATARQEGRPDMVFSYTEINPWWEPRKVTEPKVPCWSKVPFWDDLDAVGINFYLPGRYSDGNGGYDKLPRTADEMVTYGETHNFQSDTVPNLQDLQDYFVTRKGYSVRTKPVIFPEDGCTSTYLGAANPAAPPFSTLRKAPDFTEQANLYEAHFKLAARHGGGWLAGLGFWQTTPTARWGGPYQINQTDNYSEEDAYFAFLGTPTEAVVKTYFSQP